MYYTSQDKEELEDYNERIFIAENYDGVVTTAWAEIIEHQDGDKWAMLKHASYPLIEGVDDDGEPLDAPTVDSIEDFYPPIEL